MLKLAVLFCAVLSVFAGSDKIDSKFSAILPKTLQPGDEIVLKGKIERNATRFWVSLPLGKKVADKEKNMALQLVFDFDDKNANFMFRKNNDFTSITNDPTWLARGDDFVLTFQFLQNELAVYEGDEIRHIKFITDHKHPIEKIESLDVSSYANKINVKSIDEIGFRYKNCNCK